MMPAPQRVSIPRLPLQNSGDDVPDPWTWAVPLPYQALAAPLSGAPMPAAPNTVREDVRSEHQLGYYGCLQSFLTYSFAWTRPDKGLLWWYRNGLPSEDPRFRLILDTWVHDETLLGYLGWLVTTPPMSMAAETLTPWVLELDDSPAPIDTEWESRLRRARDAKPWTGGSDSLHLGEGLHIAAPSQRPSASTIHPSASRLVSIDSTTRTATFVGETVRGWYADLAETARQLPPLKNGRNWRVDVFLKPIGFLGTYRRSRVTGLWFSGRHRYHAIGN